MAYKKTTWTEKYAKEAKPRFVEAPPKMAVKFGGRRMLIATLELIDELTNKIPKGKLATINALREKLANDFHADVTCPITTGIFTWIIAHKTEEDKAKGLKKLSPYWRVIKEDGTLNPKYPDGEMQHAEYLVQEGFKIVPNRSGKKLLVKDFEKSMYKF